MAKDRKIEFENEIFKENEIHANRELSRGTFLTSILLFLGLGIFVFSIAIRGVDLLKYLPILIIGGATIIVMASTLFWGKTERVENIHFKRFLLIQFLIAMTIVNIILPKHGILGWAIILVVTNHYFNPKFLRRVYIAVLILLLFSIYLGAIFGEWDPTLLGTSFSYKGSIILEGYPNPIPEDDMTPSLRIEYLLQDSFRLFKIFLYYFLVRAAILTVIFFICNTISQRTLRLLNIEANESREKEKQQNELAIATAVQAGNLPTIFPKTERGEIFAMMDPAKEVGGDFYDFYRLNENRIGFVVGDVSGKGVPASLYMMKACTVIKTLSHVFKEKPAVILEKANKALCENNYLNLFVTCWFGIIDFQKGVLTYANAGHNPPIIKKDGEFSYLRNKPGIFLGAFDGVKYQEHSIKFNKGDGIFVYTDGVTEANNINNQLYGEERLLDFIKHNDNGSPKDLVIKIRKELAEFSKDTIQFDDITMLCLSYNTEGQGLHKVFKNDTKEMQNVLDFIDDNLKDFTMSEKIRNNIKICVEEIFVNICHYAYEGEGDIKIKLDFKDNLFNVTFVDSGVPFDPLAKADPNIHEDFEKRQIGGLGIFMVKKMSEEVSYTYEDNKNQLLVKFKVH